MSTSSTSSTSSTTLQTHVVISVISVYCTNLITSFTHLITKAMGPHTTALPTSERFRFYFRFYWTLCFRLVRYPHEMDICLVEYNNNNNNNNILMSPFITPEDRYSMNVYIRGDESIFSLFSQGGR